MEPGMSSEIVIFDVYYTYMKPWNWDYNLPDDWQPKTDDEWEWYLVRKINYNDLGGITHDQLMRHFPVDNRELDPGKRVLVEYYLWHKQP